MNYGFHDPANDNHQATLLFDPTAAAGSKSSDLENPVTQHSSMDMVVGPEGPDETALTWARAVLSGKEAIFAFGERQPRLTKPVFRLQTVGAGTAIRPLFWRGPS